MRHDIESEVADFKSFAIFNEGIASFLPKLSIPYEKEYDIETWIAFGIELRKTSYFYRQSEHNTRKKY